MKKLTYLLIFVYLNAVNVNLYLKWKNSYQFVGFYVAKEKGFYKEKNITVNIVPFNFKSSIIDNVLNNPLSFGISDTKLIIAKLNKKPVIALFPIFEKTPLALVANNTQINSFKDLKKRKYKIDSLSLKDVIIKTWLKFHNIDKNNFKIVSCPNYSKCDIFAIYRISELFHVKHYHKIFTPEKDGLDFYGDILFTSEKTAQKFPSITQNFKTASIKGWKYALSHPKEALKIAIKYTKLNKNFLSFQQKQLQKFIGNFKFDYNKIHENEMFIKMILHIHSYFEPEDFVFNPYILSKEERNFLKKHIIKIGTTNSWPPFNFGNIRGISIDLIKYISQKTGMKYKIIVQNSWSDVIKAFKNRQIDMTTLTTKTKQKEKYAIFTIPYTAYPIVFATKNNVSFIPDIDFLKNKTIAVGKDYSVAHILKNRYPFLKLLEVKNTKKALEAVKNKKAFAAADILPTIAYEIAKNRYYDLIINGQSGIQFKLQLMLRKDYKILNNIINRVIKEIPKNKKEEMLNRYVFIKYTQGIPKSEYRKIKFKFIAIIFSLIILTVFLIMHYKKIKRLKNQIEYEANHDKLTDILNRKKLNEEIEKAIEFSKRYNIPLSFIYFDIDNFKKINDTYGHEFGDYVLQKLSKIVTNNLRKTDLFGRWGGEEFLIALPNTDLKKALEVAEKIRKIIQNISFKNKKITISLGVDSLKPNDTYKDIFSRLDKALYTAKKEGKNRVVYIK